MDDSPQAGASHDGPSRDPSPGDMPHVPWDRKPSIFEHLAAHHNHDGPGLLPGGAELPDEALRHTADAVQWAPGAMDGVLTHHCAGQEESGQVEELFQLCRDYWESPTVGHKVALYERLVDHGVVGMLDPLIEKLSQCESINHDRLYDVARSFALEAPDREPVKFGAALLGLYGQPDDLPMFRILGRHDELTLFCAVALANTAEDGELEMWSLAQNVFGWGRIHIVERLADTEAPNIQNWLLREGYRNEVMYEYLAYTCATAGKLLKQLEASAIDNELFVAAGELLRAMRVGGPAESLEDYDDGAAAADRYLCHASGRPLQIDTLLTVRFLREFLEDEHVDWNRLADMGWTDRRRRDMALACGKLLAQPGWRDLVHQALRAAEGPELLQAQQAAETLRLDIWPLLRQRVADEPQRSLHWQLAAQCCPPHEIDGLIALAQQALPLETLTLAHRPEAIDNPLGLGPDWEWHRCLAGLLQALARHPGKGLGLIAAGLADALPRNRHLALQALFQWDAEAWTPELVETLRLAADAEPDGGIREQLSQLLQSHGG